jgi:hypothetical protein
VYFSLLIQYSHKYILGFYENNNLILELKASSDGGASSLAFTRFPVQCNCLAQVQQQLGSLPLWWIPMTFNLVFTEQFFLNTCFTNNIVQFP